MAKNTQGAVSATVKSGVGAVYYATILPFAVMQSHLRVFVAMYLSLCVEKMLL